MEEKNHYLDRTPFSKDTYKHFKITSQKFPESNRTDQLKNKEVTDVYVNKKQKQ